MLDIRIPERQMPAVMVWTSIVVTVLEVAALVEWAVR